MGKRSDGSEGGVSNALHASFDNLEQQADSEMERLIEQMRHFEGTSRGASDNAT